LTNGNVATDITHLSIEEVRSLYSAMRDDSQLFARVCLPHIIQNDIPDFHKYIYSALDKRYRYMAVVMFRGGAKSTLSRTVKGLHRVCFAKEPVMIWISESIAQASADLVTVQDEIAGNDTIKSLFGELKGEVWNQESCEFKNGVYITAKGYGSRIRGLKWKNQRPTNIGSDDFESETNSATEDQRIKVRNWINNQIIPAGDVNTSYEFFGTICHPEAFLAKAKNMSFFQPPNGFYYEKAIEEGGIPTWPKRYPMEWIKEREKFFKEQNNYAGFLQEYYNIPAILGKPVFNMDMVKEWDGVFETYDHITYIKSGYKKIPVNVFIGVDPARSLSETADNTVMFVIGVTPSKDYICLEIFGDRISPHQQVEKIFELASRYRPRHVEIESNGYQLALSEWCRTRMIEGRRPAFAIREYESRKSKDNKFLLGLEPIINYGKLYKIKDCQGYELFDREARLYNSEVREHDDSLDGLYDAIEGAWAPGNYDVDEVISNLKKEHQRKVKPMNWVTI